LSERGDISEASFHKVHLDDPKLTKAEQTQAVMLQTKNVDSLIFRKAYKEIGVEKNDVVRVTGFDVEKNRIHAKTASGRKIEINPQRQDFFSPATHESRAYSVGDRVETRAIIRLDDPVLPRISNGTHGVITEIDGNGAKIKWAREEHESHLKNDDLRFIDHAYAHTSYKEQGATNDREIIAVSVIGARVFNKLAAYVAASRARDNTEIVTSDLSTMRKNAGQDVEKTTAVDMKRDATQDKARTQQQSRDQSRGHVPNRSGMQQTPEKVKDKSRLLEL
jgi:ATP-dependent exoDNAse (exonuclease V) alpha subunit